MKTGLALVCFTILLGMIPVAAQDYATAGALQHDGQWEIGVHLKEQVATTGAQMDSRYTVQGANVRFIRYEPLSHSVVLGISARPASIQLNGFTTTNGTQLPSLTLPLAETKQSWTVTGSNELGFHNQAIALGNDRFDLISGASQLYNRYDEAVFLHETIQGDFAIQVRVVDQENSTPFAKAGLMMREALDTGRPRPADSSDPSQAFSRYLSAQVNPAEGNNQHEVAFRPYLGGIDSPNDPTEFSWFNPAPAYSNAWLRLTRTGNTIKAEQGNDGQTWTSLGEYTLPAPPLGNSLYVGMFYSPEIGNIPPQSGARREFMAQFADYKRTGGSNPTEQITLAIQKVGTQIEVSWNGSGTLESTTALVSPNWQTVTSTSPHRTTPEGARFYRVRVAQ